MSPQANCAVVFGTAGILILWLGLLLTSLLARPRKPSSGIRLIDKFLVAASLLMILFTIATYLVVRVELLKTPATQKNPSQRR
jgi:hypothetical protein